MSPYFRAGIREGDWKLIWRTPLPAAVELYNIAQDPSEKNDVAAVNPDKVAALQKRANELSATMAKPLLLQAEFGAMRERLHMPPALPGGGSFVQRGRLILYGSRKDSSSGCSWKVEAPRYLWCANIQSELA